MILFVKFQRNDYIVARDFNPWEYAIQTKKSFVFQVLKKDITF